MQKSELKVGQQVIVDIKRLGINGEGIAFYKGLAVFVDNAIPGEGINVEITKLTDKMAFAKVIEFKHESEFRVKPMCPYYEICGGCQSEHIEYNKMAEFKRNLVIEALERYTKLNPKSFEIKETFKMENNLGYRFKSSLTACSRFDKISLGLIRPNSNIVTPIDNCLTQNEIVNKINKEVESILNKHGFTAFDSKTQKGDIRNVVVRVSHYSNEAQVTLVYAYKNLDKKLSLAAKDIINIEHVVSVAKSYHDQFDDGLVIQKECVILEGKKTIVENIGKYKFELSPESFFQLNPVQTENLYQLTLKACKLSHKENVLDLYCGAGTIGIYMSNMAKNIIGVELNEAAVINARENAKKNKVKNAKYYVGSVDDVLPELLKENINIDVVVCDPPRSGLGEDVCKTLLNNDFKRIVYVSCNPSTLAKDINVLTKKYQVKYMQPVDMFPHTSHVETIVLLQRKMERN